jgi:hypothetical protein
VNELLKDVVDEANVRELLGNQHFCVDFHRFGLTSNIRYSVPITFLLQLSAEIEACRPRDRDPLDLEAKSGSTKLSVSDFAQEGIDFVDARVM